MTRSAAEPGEQRARIADVASVQALERGLAVIRAFDVDHPRMTLSEVARRAALSRATTRRLLHTLVGAGYVALHDRHFTLRPRILELGHAYLSSMTVPDVARAHLEELSERVNESCSVAVLDDCDVVYVARVATKSLMAVDIHVGTRFPAHLTSLGRVLLADLSEEELDDRLERSELAAATPYTVTDPEDLRSVLFDVARQGWAFVDQELEVGLRSIAAPVRGPDGRVRAALNISASARRGTPDKIRSELLPELLRTARAIERDLALVVR